MSSLGAAPGESGRRELDAHVPTGRSLRLWRVVLSMARPPDPPEIADRGAVRVGHAERLVLEFDEAYTAFVEGFVELPTERQLLALQAVDSKLAAMVRARHAALWTERARRDEPTWQEVRRLASGVLAAFDWPRDVR